MALIKLYLDEERVGKIFSKYGMLDLRSENMVSLTYQSRMSRVKVAL